MSPALPSSNQNSIIMINTIKRIIRESPVVNSFNPKVCIDCDKSILLIADSDAEAVRIIDVIRSKGYNAGFYSMYDGNVIRIPNV